MKILRRNKAFTLLNVLGLSTGVAASVLIFLVIRWETSYDSYHKNKDSIFRLVTTMVSRSNGEPVSRHAYAPLGLGDIVRKEVPGVERVAAYFKYSAWQAHIGVKGLPDSRVFLQKEIISAEPELFGMLDVSFLDGSAGGLKEPGTCVISASVAEKWFGSWR